MSRVSKNIIANLFGQAMTLLPAMVAVRFIFRDLGSDALGLIYFILTLNAVLCAALEMGVCATLVREVAAHRWDSPDYVCSLVQTASFLYWTAYLVLAGALYVAAPLLVHRWIKLSTMPAAQAIMLVRVLGIAAVTSLPRMLYVSVFRGLERMTLNNTIDAVFATIQQVGAIVILVLGGGLAPVIYWLSGCLAVWVGAYVMTVGRIFSWRAMVPTFSMAVVRRTLKFSAQMASISVLGMVHSQADKVIVSRFLPIADMGYYGLASQLVAKTSMAANAVGQAAYPSLSALLKRGDRQTALQSYLKLQDLLCWALVPVFAGLVFAVLPMFSLLFNPRIAWTMLLPTLWLCVGQYMNGTLTVPYIYSVADGRPDIAVWQNVIALFVSTPIAVWMTLRYGLSGAAFSWVVYHVIAYAYGLPEICRNCVGIKASQWYWHVAKAMGAALACYGGAWEVCVLCRAFGLQALAIAYLAATAAFAVWAYQLVSDSVRAALTDMVKRVSFLRVRLGLEQQ